MKGITLNTYIIIAANNMYIMRAASFFSVEQFQMRRNEYEQNDDNGKERKRHAGY